MIVVYLILAWMLLTTLAILAIALEVRALRRKLKHTHIIVHTILTVSEKQTGRDNKGRFAKK